MDQKPRPDQKPSGEGDRIIRGAEAIAEYIFGDRESRRKICYLAKCSRIPIFRFGSTLCLRPEALQELDRNSGAALHPQYETGFLKKGRSRPRPQGRGFFFARMIGTLRTL